MLSFKEAVHATWPIVIASKGGHAAEAGPAELVVAGSCRWGGRKVQPSPGSDTKGEVVQGPQPVKVKGCTLVTGEVCLMALEEQHATTIALPPLPKIQNFCRLQCLTSLQT